MIYFYFQIDLENDDLDEFLRPKGALFNKWLPCGRNSSIELLPDDDENKIKVWFDRRGETKNGFVAYNYRERKVDTAIMSKQAKLDSGPLCGEAIYKNVSQEEIDAVKNDLIDSDDYIRIGKKIVKFLYPPLSNFIQLLRTRYGQYWLPELESWDSRKTVLTIYCNYLRLHWKTEKNQKWQRFQPTKQVLNLKCQIQTGSQYLTKEDWSNIKKQFSNEEITLSEILLTKSRSLYEEGHLRQALVEGVASLELAISDFISRSKNYSKSTTEAAKRFFDLPIKSQVAVIGTANSIVTQENLENTIKTIEIRNKIVHEGYIPEIDNISSNFQDLCSFIAALTGKGAFKFPELNTGNALTD